MEEAVAVLRLFGGDGIMRKVEGCCKADENPPTNLIQTIPHTLEIVIGWGVGQKFPPQFCGANG